MRRPTQPETDAAAAILARDWDADGRIAGGLATSYAEWGFGIADMIGNEAPFDAVVEYLGVLEEQLGVERSPLGRRIALAERLSAAIRAAAAGRP
jgi:hypothetical protein